MASGRLTRVKAPLRVLVTGSEGFLGRAVVAALRQGGHRVTGYSHRKGQDVLDLPRLVAAAGRKDVVVHLAGRIGVDSAELFRVNVLGTANALEAARRAGAAVVLASSAGAKEPKTDYGRSKRLAEDLAMRYVSLGARSADGPGVPGVAILRFFNLYGEGDSRGVVARFLREDPIILDGGGVTVRDFLHVSDAADAVARCLAPEGLLVTDVGSGKGLAIRDLAKLFNKQVLPGTTPVHGQIQRSVARPSSIPGWRPRVRLADWVSSQVGQAGARKRMRA